MVRVAVFFAGQVGVGGAVPDVAEPRHAADIEDAGAAGGPAIDRPPTRVAQGVAARVQRVGSAVARSRR